MLPDEALGNLEEDQQNDTYNSGDNPKTQEDLEGPDEQQPDQALNKADDQSTVSAQAYRDTSRVSPRANEASDRNDTNTGGIIAGAAKGTSQS